MSKTISHATFGLTILTPSPLPTVAGRVDTNPPLFEAKRPILLLKASLILRAIQSKSELTRKEIKSLEGAICNTRLEVSAGTPVSPYSAYIIKTCLIIDLHV